VAQAVAQAALLLELHQPELQTQAVVAQVALNVTLLVMKAAVTAVLALSSFDI
jgi:hypothetical protein